MRLRPRLPCHKTTVTFDCFGKLGGNNEPSKYDRAISGYGAIVWAKPSLAARYRVSFIMRLTRGAATDGMVPGSCDRPL